MSTILKERVKELLKAREFIYAATSDFNHRPNAAPKFLLKIEENFIYLADHVIGTTYKNLKINSQVSLAVMDRNTLHGYQINGAVELLTKGATYDQMIKEVHRKEIGFTTERLIEAVRTGKRHENFEVAFPEEVVIYKVKIKDIVEIGPRGQVSREQAEKIPAESCDESD